MSAIDPNAKATIICLTEPTPIRNPDIVDAKIKIIDDTLDKCRGLKADAEVLERICNFTKRSKRQKVHDFRIQCIFDGCVSRESAIKFVKIYDFLSPQDIEVVIQSLGAHKGIFDPIKGTLTLKEELSTDDLWDFVEKHEVQELVIRQNDGREICYNRRVLEQLAEIKPSIADLTQQFTLIFEKEGKEIIETKAKLLLCGRNFDAMIRWAEMRESSRDKIVFKEDLEIGSSILLNGFFGILEEVEKGKRSPSISDEEYEIACDFLLYSMWYPKIPEGALGPEEWKTYYGLEVEAPPLPEDINEILSSPCPFFKDKKVSDTHLLFLMPKGLTLNQMQVLAKDPNPGNKLKKGYRYYWDKIQARYGDQPIEESYWVLVTTDVLPKSRRKTRQKQLPLASSKEGYEAPSLLEAVVLNLVEHVRSGKRLFGDDPWTYTCCREGPIDGYKLVVGGFAPVGLRVIADYDDSDVGVASRRKF